MGRIKVLIGLVLVAAVIYAIWNVAPVYLAKYQFEDELASIAKFSADHTEEQIHDEVMKKAKDIGVPVLPENVHVVKDSGHVTITANYNVVFQLPNGKQWVLSFNTTSNKT